MHPCVMLFLNDYFRKLVIGHKRPTFLWQWSSCTMSEQIGRQDHQEICLHLEVGDWTPECCCKQSPEKNHWGILKHCSMSHLVACPKHSASKINRSTDFSGSKVQKQRARWNWHHVAHSSDGGWIYIWSMFFFNLPWISFLLMKNISEVGGGGKSCWQCRTDGRSWKLQGQAQQELAAYIQKNLGKTWPPPNIKKVTQKPAKSHTPFDASATWYQYSGVIFEKKIGKGCFRWLHIVFTKLYLSHLWQFLHAEV